MAGVLPRSPTTLIAGFAVPAQRTFFMVAVVALACGRSPCSASRVLAAAARRGAPRSLGGARARLLAFVRRGRAIFYAVAARTGTAGRCRGAVREQAVVTVAMLPMLAALFQELSVVSPLANAFAIPVVSLLVVPLALARRLLRVSLPLDLAHALMRA